MSTISISAIDTINRLSTGNMQSDVSTKIAAAVLKQVQAQQQQMGEAIVEMIEATPTPGATGQKVNFLA